MKSISIKTGSELPPLPPLCVNRPAIYDAANNQWFVPLDPTYRTRMGQVCGTFVPIADFDERTKDVRAAAILDHLETGLGPPYGPYFGQMPEGEVWMHNPDRPGEATIYRNGHQTYAVRVTKEPLPDAPMEFGKALLISLAILVVGLVVWGVFL